MVEFDFDPPDRGTLGLLLSKNKKAWEILSEAKNDNSHECHYPPKSAGKSVLRIMSSVKTDLIIITAIVVAGFLIYFAFVYGRIASIKVKITAVEKQIELDAGGKAK